MEQLDVIEKINEPTEWVNSMVTVVKPNGKLRILQLEPKCQKTTLLYKNSGRNTHKNAKRQSIFGS